MLKFKGYCAEHNIKQSEIARLIRKSQPVVNAKINGRVPWTLEQIKIICKHYGISADEYFI